MTVHLDSNVRDEIPRLGQRPYFQQILDGPLITVPRSNSIQLKADFLQGIPFVRNYSF